MLVYNKSGTVHIVLRDNSSNCTEVVLKWNGPGLSSEGVAVISHRKIVEFTVIT